MFAGSRRPASERKSEVGEGPFEDPRSVWRPSRAVGWQDGHLTYCSSSSLPAFFRYPAICSTLGIRHIALEFVSPGERPGWAGGAAAVAAAKTKRLSVFALGLVFWPLRGLSQDRVSRPGI